MKTPYRKGDIEEVENEKTGRIEYHAKVTESKKFVAAALFDTIGEAQRWVREKTEPPKPVTLNG